MQNETTPSIGIIGFFIILLSGCIIQGLSVSLNQPFSLALGESAVISSEGISVQFTEMIEDSRCATGVQCVWEGRGVVLVSLFKNNQLLGTASLATNESIKIVDQYIIEFVALSPHPSRGENGEIQPIHPNEYVATFTINRV